VRVADSIWDSARARAEEDDVTLSYVVTALVDGYGRGLIDLPRVEAVFTQLRDERPEEARPEQSA
jgi:hypothetical protein